MKTMLLAWVLCLTLSLCALAEPALSVVPSGERENTDASENAVCGCLCKFDR